MDLIHFLALVYICIVTPLASFGAIVIYALLSAFLSAREERLKESRDAPESENW